MMIFFLEVDKEKHFLKSVKAKASRGVWGRDWIYEWAC
jgi:hypothetical protein